MQNSLFDFEKARVQGLTLDQLERTHKENRVTGEPVMGIYHFALLQQVLQMCAEFGYNAEVYDLFAAQNKDRSLPGVVVLPQVEAIYGQRAVEAHILRRVYANIRLTDFDNEENTTNLAVAFHQKGIHVGFGNMVKICHNQCMLSPTQYAATYSEKGKGRGNGITIPEIIETVKSWLFDARQIVVTEREKIEKMQNLTVDADTIFRIIGLLTALRVKCDSRHSGIHEHRTYPLNQSQISQFTEALLIKYHEERHISAWDMYNAATDLYKANSMDIPALLPQNRAMAAFLDEQFQF